MSYFAKVELSSVELSLLTNLVYKDLAFWKVSRSDFALVLSEASLTISQLRSILKKFSCAEFFEDKAAIGLESTDFRNRFKEDNREGGAEL